MSKHQKPTKEQLKAGMNKALEEFETLPPEDPVTPPAVTPDPAEPVIPPTEDPAPLDLATVRTKKLEELSDAEKDFVSKHVAELTEEEKQELGVAKPASSAPETDWEKKFKESSREAQVIGFKNKELNKAIEAAAELVPPTEEEMAAIYPSWEELDEFQRSIARDNQLSKRKFDLIQGATAKFKEVDSWNEKVDEFITDPKTLIAHPDLEGKEDDFKVFAAKPTRRGLELDDLVLAYRGDRILNPPKSNKGTQMFEQGSSRAPAPAKPIDTRLSPEEGEVIRKSDYKRFVALLKAGKIRTE